jgi:NarL family two-component system response regulator YdfI
VIRTAIVDDAADLRMLLRLQLEHDDRFEVVGEAGDGVEGLDLIATEDPDLVVLDLAMPRMDGLEVLEELRRRNRDRPVVVFSGFTSNDVVAKALALGAVDYIKKGTDLQQIAELLARAATGQRASS